MNEEEAAVAKAIDADSPEHLSDNNDDNEKTGVPARIDQSLGISQRHIFLLLPLQSPLTSTASDGTAAAASPRPSPRCHHRRLQRSSSSSVVVVRVSWEFSSACTLLDWIGLYSAEERDPLAFMDHRGFGVCGPQHGAVDWHIAAEMLQQQQQADDKRNNNNGGGIHGKNSNGKLLEFRYFDGLTGAVKASSPPLLVYNDAQLAVSALICRGLPRSVGNKPARFYAKISCSGSNNRQYRTPLSASGEWTSLNFLFPVDRSVELRLRVKAAHRGWPSATGGGKLLGEANIPLLDILDGAIAAAESGGDNNNSGNSRHFSFLLRPQCQQVLMKCRLVPPRRQPLAETMSTLQGGMATTAMAHPTERPPRLDANGNHLLDLPPNCQHSPIPPVLSLLRSSSSCASSSGTFASGIACSSSASTSGQFSTMATTARMEQSHCSTSTSTSSSSTSQFHTLLADSTDGSSVKLPPGWEMRVDGRGRVFYMDHNRHRTAWNPPLLLECADQDDHQQQQQSGTHAIDAMRTARRTVFGREAVDERRQQQRQQQQLDAANGNCGGANSSSSSSPTGATAEQPDDGEWPTALAFLLRADLFAHLLQCNQDALERYNASPFLKHIVQRIRREPAKFWQFEHNRELIGFVNAFADRTQPLATGWQMARQWGQPLFVDHCHRRITPFDPRLPQQQQPNAVAEQRGGGNGSKSAPPLRRRRKPTNTQQQQQRENVQQNAGGNCGRPTGNVRSVPNAVNGGGGSIWSWELADKAEQIQALLAQHDPELAERVSAKLRLIGRMGELALRRYANDTDLVRAISLLEQLEARGELRQRCQRNNGAMLSNDDADDANGNGTTVVRGGQHSTAKAAPAASRFEQTMAQFHQALERDGNGKGPGKIKFRLHRERLMEDAYQKILAVDAAQLRRCQMTVSFADEDGLDYGGPSRELFFLLSRELFHPRHALFEYASSDTHRVQVSAMSKFVEHHLRWMELCGRILGLALVHRCLVDCFFTLAFYKQLAQIPISLEDLREADPQFFHSLSWLQRNNATSGGGGGNVADLDLTFCVTEAIAGEIAERELVPNGRNVPVTDKNRAEFIERMVQWRVERGVHEQMRALQRGLHAVIDPKHMRLFNAEQLELALSGTIQIDLLDWERHTEYRGGYSANHIVIRWFWHSVHGMRNAERLRLLQFVTGSASVPFEGFKGLQGSNGPKRFCIERWGAEASLPRAHTCFNRLDLPAYPNRQTLLAKLMLAITESSSYAIE